MPSAHGNWAQSRAITRKFISRDAIVVYRQAVTGHSDVPGSPVQALFAFSTLFHGPVCILYHVFIPTLIPVHAALPDGLELFAIRCSVRYLHHGVHRLGRPLVFFGLLQVQVKGSNRSPINGIHLPGRHQMSSVDHSTTQRVSDAWPEVCLEDESK